MKKRQNRPSKEKEFSTSPFTALKGVKAAVAATEPSVAATPSAKTASKVEADDISLFFQAMADVERLGDAKKGTALPDRLQFPVKAVVRKIEEEDQQLFLDAVKGLKLDVRFDDSIPEEPAGTRPAGSRLLRQLRRGSIRLDYELDLHGISGDEVDDALSMFIGGAFRRQQQAVLVITGKGMHSQEDPVIKRRVEIWLKEDGGKMVAEFLQAPRQLGGEGAIVVFLKKSSDPFRS